MAGKRKLRTSPGTPNNLMGAKLPLQMTLLIFKGNRMDQGSQKIEKFSSSRCRYED